MLFLNDDLIRYIALFLHLNLNNLLNFSIVNKNINIVIDDIFYKQLAILYYSSDFWKRAYNRPVYISKPLKNIKMELIRIENFQKILDRNNLNRWTQKDFYNYWKANNDYYINHKLDEILSIL